MRSNWRRRRNSSRARATGGRRASANAAARSRAASASASRSQARLLKDPPIMVFDEATSALDATTERLIQKALEAAMKGRTTFVIAHRLATVRNADHILVFDQGEIVESGAFDELVAKGGRFATARGGAVHDRADDFDDAARRGLRSRRAAARRGERPTSSGAARSEPATERYRQTKKPRPFRGAATGFKTRSS